MPSIFSRIAAGEIPCHRVYEDDAEPAADDAEGQALLARFRGRRLPMVDRVEVSVIEESQPNWLAFLNGQLDAVTVPGEFLLQAAPGGPIVAICEPICTRVPMSPPSLKVGLISASRASRCSGVTSESNPSACPTA